MLKNELFEVIINFQDALRRGRLPDFKKNKHRAAQVLRILKVDYHNFHDNEEARCCDDAVRALWEKEFVKEDDE
jgi:hypothetical protein